MLGNWSFGDYFKKEAIAWAWELLTEVWKLDKTRLHATVFEGDPANGIPRDDEAAGFWQSGRRARVAHPPRQQEGQLLGDGRHRPVRPLHRDPHRPHARTRPAARSSTRARREVIEIWNLVFIQFNRNADQSLTPLPAKHVDTGMGFERITRGAAGQGQQLRHRRVHADLRGDPEGDARPRRTRGKLDDLKDTAYRVIADHIRTLTFALTDGAPLGNDGRGYVLQAHPAPRRALRLAGTSARQEPFLHKLVPAVVEHMGDAFPELKRDPQKVRDQILDEEDGVPPHARPRHHAVQQDRERDGEDRPQAVVSGEDAFKLHDTYGVSSTSPSRWPPKQGLTVDRAGYEKAMEEAKNKAREGGKKFAVIRRQGRPAADRRLAEVSAPTGSRRRSLGWVKDNAVVTTGKLTAGESVALLARPHQLLRRAGRAGRRHRHDPLARPAPTSRSRTRSGSATPSCTSARCTTASSRSATRSTLLQTTTRRIDIMRNHTATHLLNLALRRGARRARRAEGLARRRREDALRLHPRQAADARGTSRDRAARQRADRARTCR